MAKKADPQKIQLKIAGSPWEACETCAPADASAIQALFRGDATDIQQKRAINFITNDLCVLPFLAFDPKNPRNTDFALGKQSVGHAIVRLMRLNIGQFTGD
jgi:hypothetical protein